MEEINPSEIAGEVVGKALDAEVVKNLFGPLTANVGQALGTVGEILRFYAEGNLARVFTKWARQRSNQPVDAAELQRVLPLLQEAAMQSDDELQDRWASLLENTAEGRKDVLPSFGETLSQLSVQEARYLDRIWEAVTTPKDVNTGKRLGRDDLGLYALQRLYEPPLPPSPNPAEMWLHRAKMSKEQIDGYDAYTQFELVLHDLERLSLLEKITEVGLTNRSHQEVGTRTSYALTQYGVSFIQAVRPRL